LGQFSQAENTGVPGFEQSFLKRCTTIKVWLEIKQAFGGNAALKKHLYASSSGAGWKISEPGRGSRPPKELELQVIRRASLSACPANRGKTRYCCG
jgi:hypothetical protein